MTTIVQTATTTITSTASSISVTFGSPTTVGNSIIVILSGFIGATGKTVSASNTGTALTWTARHVVQEAPSDSYVAGLFDSLNTTAAISTLAVNCSSADLAGTVYAYEIAGGTAALDFVVAADSAVTGTSLTATGSPEVGTTDFVVAGIVLTLYNTTVTGLTTPTGSPAWTGDYNNLVSTYAHCAGNISHRIESSALTPAATWTWSPTATASAFIAGYSVSGGGGGTSISPSSGAAALQGVAPSMQLGVAPTAGSTALIGQSPYMDFRIAPGVA